MAIVSRPDCGSGEQNRPSIDELVTRYRAKLVDFIRYNFHLNEADAEEAAMDALFAAWKALDRFDPARARVTTWLYNIARNKALDVCRAAKRAQRWERSLEEVPECEMAGPGPAERHEERLRRQELAQRLRRLTGRERSCVFNVHGMGRSVPALAVASGLSERQVRLALHRGMYRLRHHGRRPQPQPKDSGPGDWTWPGDEGPAGVPARVER